MEQALGLFSEWREFLFDLAPVMMHLTDENGIPVKVNRRWLSSMGYERTEVLGQLSVEFLTDESRLVAVRDTLPLFWEVGAARSIGYRMVRRNGRPFDVLLDAELMGNSDAGTSTIATIRPRHDQTGWHWASAALESLQDLDQVQRHLNPVLSRGLPETKNAGANSPELLGQRRQRDLGNGVLTGLAQGDPQILDAEAVLQKYPANESFSLLVEASRDIAANLRGLVNAHQGWQEAILEQQSELLAVVRNMDKTLAELADAATAYEANAHNQQ